MFRNLSVRNKVLLGYGTVFAVLLTAVLMAIYSISRIESTTALLGEEAARQQVYLLWTVEWVALAVGAVLTLFWSVHIYRSMSRVVDQYQNIAARVSETADRCATGDEAVRKAQEAVAGTKAEIDRIVQRMLVLGHKSREIRRAQEVITDFSDQATVLSFNATLEATAAGEAGRSFGVLAEQLARVSEEARSAVKDVRRLVRDFEDSTNTAILATEEGLKAAELSVDVQNNATHCVHSIAESVELAHRIAQEIRSMRDKADVEGMRREVPK